MICQSEPYAPPDFATTNNVLALLTSFKEQSRASDLGVKELTQILSPLEQETLLSVSGSQELHATLLPIRTVGVQVRLCVCVRVRSEEVGLDMCGIISRDQVAFLHHTWYVQQ